MSSPTTVNQAALLMTAFAERTGVTGKNAPQRYLWTDAFAVCNCLGLAEISGQEQYLTVARSLVEQVHHVLGRHRSDSPCSGWLSGLTEEQGEAHPTAGGLRIGKRLPERGEAEPFDEHLEWDRDGQYFHYLTKWMHALARMAQATGERRYNFWARELAQAAHRGFVWGPRRAKRMAWKLSADLSRVLVPSMGQHDALDGWITSAELDATAEQLGDHGQDLRLLIADFAQMTGSTSLVTADPLGLGGLLTDALRVARLMRSSGLVSIKLLETLLDTARVGLERYARGSDLHQPVARRLAFRELGLAIGLKALTLIEHSLSEVWLQPAQGQSALSAKAHIEHRLDTLSPYRDLCSQIESFWLDPVHRDSSSWLAHQDINDVMLATCLVPEGFFGPEDSRELSFTQWT